MFLGWTEDVRTSKLVNQVTSIVTVIQTFANSRTTGDHIPPHNNIWRQNNGISILIVIVEHNLMVPTEYSAR